MYDICIIGAGASGMMAAITAKKENKDANIIVLEKLDAPGKKLGATGNGKCNISNVNCNGYRDVLEVFQELGVMTRTDGSGRIYPYSEDAKDVVNSLVSSMNRLGIKLKCSSHVISVVKTKEGFKISLRSGDVIYVEKLLIAAGGKAGSKFGTTGDGTKIAKSLGHSVTRLAPSLTAIEIKENVTKLAGTRAKCKIALSYDKKLIREESGEVQFTKYGISGICVFNLSKYIVIPKGMVLKEGFEKYQIKIDFLPEFNDIEDLLKKRQTSLDEDFMISLVKKPLAEYIIEKGDNDPTMCTQLIKEFTLTPKNLRGWEFAQVTAGGVSYDEVNKETMESKCVEGLFFAGEVLDYDGLCGGYNLQHAWETGIKAGRNIGRTR